MKHLGNLKRPEGSKTKKRRIGRGTGSGYGRTATRGHKGQKSRSGFGQPLGFEGGQMPLNRRIPKFGFYNKFRTEYQIVNVGYLQELVDSEKLQDKVDFDTLYGLGVIKKKKLPLKILGNGELNTALNIVADKFSESAKQKIESAGGTVTYNG